MRKPKVEDYELIAHLSGNRSKHVEKALSRSSELQQDFSELQEFIALLDQSVGGVLCPDPLDLVDVATGQATDAQRLIVAAYERESVVGHNTMKLLRNEYEQATEPKARTKANVRWWSQLPLLVATPVVSATGLRSSVDVKAAKVSDDQILEQNLEVAELSAQVAIRASALNEEQWVIDGHVSEDNTESMNCKVTLRSDKGWKRTRTTDKYGMFSFSEVPQGRYRLRIYLANGVVYHQLELS